MLLAVDVDYRDDGAVAAGVFFRHWEDATPAHELAVGIERVSAYVPGQLYRRELPCIRALLEHCSIAFDLVIIDGFVHLGPQKKAGLGWHLWDLLGRGTPVIGVAKTAFQDTPPQSAVWRGSSKKPLYVTAVGTDLAAAKNHVRSMAGAYRIPTLLKRVDALCRQ